jgi:hypothetical protein
MLAGAVVVGFFVLTRTGRAIFRRQALHHWTDTRGRLRPPQTNRRRAKG